MPHSSGGGSHSGGSHSSSHHSSGGGSHGGGYHGPSYRHSTEYFPGARRYVYYRHRRPYYYYSDAPVSSEESNGSSFGIINLFLILFYIPFIAGVIMLLTNSVNVPVKITSSYDNEIIIEDNAGVFADAGNLEDALEEFLDKTGITPAIYTVYNEDWQDSYGSLEDYAYDLYISNFSDEYHWLLVYSEPADPDDSFIDWYWEGMQGNYTDGILTTDITDDFNDLMQKYLTASSRYSVEDAFTLAFADIQGSLMKTTIDPMVLCLAVFISLFIAAHAIIMFGSFIGSRKKKTKMIPDEIDDPEELQCDYCRGYYIRGMYTECPHCGSPAKF